jgi:hypothetical protein
MIEVRIIGVKTRKVNTALEVEKAIRRAMEKTAKTTEGHFKEIMSTWNHNTPVQRNFHYSQDAIMTIWTENKPFWYLDKGTPIRHARMTFDFVPKTAVGGDYKSGQGQGGLWYYNKNWQPSKPPVGIEPRDYTNMMAKDDAPMLQLCVNIELDKIKIV